MADINPSLPIAGQPNSSEEPKIVTALSQLVGTVNALDDTNIATGANIAAAKLDQTPWKTIYSAVGVLKGADPGGNNILSGGRVVTATDVGTDPAIFGFDPAEYAIPTKTLQLRLSVAGVTNSSSVGGNVGLNMAPVVSSSGAANNIVIGVGAAVVNVVVTPPASSAYGGVGAVVSAPAAGVYALCFNTSGAIAANSVVLMRAFLQARYI